MLDNDNIEDLSPYVLLQNFSKNRVFPAILLAIVIHAVAIVGLSTGYIYRTWINPTVEVQVPDAAAADGTDAADTGAAEDATDTSKDAGSDSGKDSSKSKKAGDDSKDPSDEPTPPVIERVTETADPEDLPDEPGGLGISIDDINE